MPRRFTLTVDRHGGEGRACKLEVRLQPDGADASLACVTDLRTAGALTPQESAELRKLTERSRLDEGGHIGYVGGLGPLETLAFRGETGRTVILVTVGNKNFVDDPARRALLQGLRELEDRLLSQAAVSR